MQEKTIDISGVDPLLIFGVNNHTLDAIRSCFPQLKLVARGHRIKAIGSAEGIRHFEEKLQLLVQYIHRHNSLSESVARELVERPASDGLHEKPPSILFHGNGGQPVSVRTANQQRIVDACRDNDMVFAIGPAGTGKTYVAIALAVKALKEKAVKRIVLTRPAVEAGEHLGFLPGDLKEKLAPYLQPLYDGLRDMVPSEKLKEYVEQDIIEIAPLAFMRGRTLDRAFVILDEAQNTTTAQMKLFLTRMGRAAKFMITGDKTQIDLPKNQHSGLEMAARHLSDVKGIGVVQLDERDVIRHPLVKTIIRKLAAV